MRFSFSDSNLFKYNISISIERWIWWHTCHVPHWINQWLKIIHVLALYTRVPTRRSKLLSLTITFFTISCCCTEIYFRKYSVLSFEYLQHKFENISKNQNLPLINTFEPRKKIFSGLISLWRIFLEWIYCNAFTWIQLKAK